MLGTSWAALLSPEGSARLLLLSPLSWGRGASPAGPRCSK